MRLGVDKVILFLYIYLFCYFYIFIYFVYINIYLLVVFVTQYLTETKYTIVTPMYFSCITLYIGGLLFLFNIYNIK